MSILKKPIITEKMNQLGELAGNKQYAFVVDESASKTQIKGAIEGMYTVKVESLRTVNVRGKKRTRYSKAGFIEGRSPNYKKAVVTLAAGQSIDFYKNI